MTSWLDYWKTFDLLLDNLSQSGRDEIVAELKAARRHVNGMTDGWFDFKAAIEKILKSNQTKMTINQVMMLHDLIESLTDALTRRG